MHTVHLVAVRAEEEEDAIGMVEHALSPYGNGDVWDWYEIGGRWDGMLGGSNIICYEDDPTVFMSALRNADAYQTKMFREVRDMLTGRDVLPSEVPDDYSVFGLAVDKPKEDIAEMITERNKAACAKAEESLLLDRPPENYDFAMCAYYLRKFSNLLGGYYCWDSGFLDGVEASTSQRYLHERLNNEDIGGGPDEQWLVVVDLHN